MSEKKQESIEADNIWAEIKSLPIGVYALKNQTVQQHVARIEVPTKELYIKLNSSAVLPALEESLGDTRLTHGKKYAVECGEGYVIIRRSVNRDAAVQQVLEDMANKASK